MTGEFDELPQAGRLFLIMNNEPLEDLEANGRFIRTSCVQEVESKGDGVVEFKTRNSTYRLQFQRLATAH